LYFTEQPYGSVDGMFTGLPAINSASACSTKFTVGLPAIRRSLSMAPR
jgi:hypothetical protein